MKELSRVEQSPPTVPSIKCIGSDLTISRRNLPHWQLGGSTYFVTFRVRERIILSPEERAMVLQSCLYGNTGTGRGATGRGETGKGACSTKWRLHAAIVMPDHVHLLLTPAEVQSGRWVSLSQIMQGIKSTTSHRINKRRGRKSPLWQDESHDRIIRDEGEFNSKLKYICENAAKTSLIEDGLNYPFFWWEGSKE
ncbi:MAG: transposase [Chloroflexi bacterium]|nr:transposase [Chloroflexota bacterium]